MTRQEAFERSYAESHDLPIETFSQYRMGDTYRLPGIASHWRTWQAALDAAEEQEKDPCDGCFMAEAESLRKDAKRYQCLRSTENWEDAFMGTDIYFKIYIIESREGSENKTGDELDAAVDALIGLKASN